MRKGAALLAMALLLAAPACHSGPVQSAGSAPAEAGLGGDKALYAAETAYAAAASAAEAAVDHGLLAGERAGQVKGMLDQAHAVLLVARAAAQAGDMGSAEANALAAIALAAGIERIVQGEGA